ncbi:MAG: hypothetical protein ACJ8GK_13430 [Luteimonas sp.]
MLLTTVVLLLLAGVMTAFAMNVGMFEQRSTGNDLRSREVNEVAEAGLAQGFEFLMHQHPDMLTNLGLWERCAATDETFPCGALSDAVFDDDGDNATAPVSRRETMYRLRADALNTIPGIAGALSRFMLPLGTASKLSNQEGGSAATYGVAPLLCMVQRPKNPGATGIACGSGTGVGATNLRIATFVSVARLPGEAASATLVQTIGQYPKLGGDLLTRPPLTTSGSAGVTGTLQVVTNPNAGGPGVPVSIWTRLNADKTGTTNTCYADEFFRYTQGSATPTLYQGSIRCDQCKCDANGAPPTLSYDNSGSLQDEGIDILDVDAGSNSTTGYHAGSHVGVNYNVKSDSLSYPLCEFPPDMFKFVFGTPAWDDNNHDCFGETKRAAVFYQNPDNTAAGAAVGPDEAYLYKNADKIIAKTANVALLKVGQAGTTALLASSASSGMIWCQQQNAGDCDIPSNAQVGTPAAPVILILDGPVRIQGVVFGFVFIRDTGTTLRPDTGSSAAGACPANCMLQMNAGAVVYGAIALQGQMKSNGTSAVVFDKGVLAAVEDEAGLVYATLPGGWTDQRSY